jgi:ubiquinol-cytochrome c reductase cytochrome c1 subunit
MIMRSLIRVGFAALALTMIAPAAVRAAGEATPPMKMAWQHAGPFGTFDRLAAQRGFQVFENVCHACHAAKYLSFRSLADLGFSDDEVKAIAAKYTVMDGPNDQGEMFERPARPSDRMPSPYPNEQASRAANGGAYPPDLSLIVKAREGGEDYLYSLLVGYEDPPADVTVPDGMYYNHYFPGHMIAMPPPLSEGILEYQDGTSATPEQMARDVAVFLTWLAEPKLEARKQTGLKVMLFLLVLTGLTYAYKRRIWANLH